MYHMRRLPGKLWLLRRFAWRRIPDALVASGGADGFGDLSFDADLSPLRLAGVGDSPLESVDDLRASPLEPEQSDGLS